jgi:hypothetical protein
MRLPAPEHSGLRGLLTPHRTPELCLGKSNPSLVGGVLIPAACWVLSYSVAHWTQLALASLSWQLPPGSWSVGVGIAPHAALQNRA